MARAARLTDLTDAGVIVKPVSTTVEIAGLPAARISDGQVCRYHGYQPIKTGSATVLVGGLRAARIGDSCTCTAAIVTAAMTVDIGD